MAARIRLRDETWQVESRESTRGGQTLYQLRSLDDGRKLTALCPPDSFETLANVPPTLDRRALSPFGLWQLRHELIRLTSTWDGLAALHAGRVQLEPYQLVPVAKLLRDPRRSLLIADDVGLGKTIEAGLCILELEARGIARRVLLVVPPGLIDQWIEEMQRKFGLTFRSIEDSTALDHAQTSLAEGVSPWAFHDRIITSTEYLKRPEVFRAALRRPWDVVVVDEAHYLAESGSPANPYSTRRTHLGTELRKSARSLILLTATPHNGYRHSFRSLLELIEPTDATLAGSDTTVRQRVGRSMVRRLKQQITRSGPDGTRVSAFVPRAPVERLDVHCPTLQEREIFSLVTRYCTKTAEAAAGSTKRDLVSFAMQIVKKRMLSSRFALRRTIDNRLEAIAENSAEDEPTPSELRELQGDLPLPETQAERIALRILRTAVTGDARHRKAEKGQLLKIRRSLEKVVDLPDPKIQRLVADLRHSVINQPGEKAIVFTEYRDTLEAVRDAFSEDEAFAGHFVELSGGLSARQRRERINTFANRECFILLATDAASEGLNLQEHCRRLYHVELPWNPNRLEQRNGRIDRYGQRREPQIAYLFYSDSPEDRVLDRLVTRISQMQTDRVSTPDIVGILEATRLPERLLAIGPDDDGTEAGDSLVRIFDEEREEFLRDVAPLLTAGDTSGTGSLDATSADSIADDDLAFESAMLRLLGSNLRADLRSHEYCLRVPIELQGARVNPDYPAVTFRRSVALGDGAEGTEFIHRLHPLARAAASRAREILESGSAGITLPPFLAVRTLAAAEQPAIVFTFLDRSTQPSGELVAVGVHLDGSEMPRHAIEKSLAMHERTGDVQWDKCERFFGERFPQLVQRGRSSITALLDSRRELETQRRSDFAALLRLEVDAYRTDRLHELTREEAAERAGRRDQAELFRDSQTNWAARRAAVATHADARLRTIAEWEQVPEIGEPEPLGILLVFPEGAV